MFRLADELNLTDDRPRYERSSFNRLQTLLSALKQRGKSDFIDKHVRHFEHMSAKHFWQQPFVTIDTIIESKFSLGVFDAQRRLLGVCGRRELQRQIAASRSSDVAFLKAYDEEKGLRPSIPIPPGDAVTCYVRQMQVGQSPYIYDPAVNRMVENQPLGGTFLAEVLNDHEQWDLFSSEEIEMAPAEPIHLALE